MTTWSSVPGATSSPSSMRNLPGEKSAGRGDAKEPAPPLVSVIIPCYNSARYLAETIESALQQTYPRVEVFVVDDGSMDETGEIARAYPVNYIYQANSGISAARNSGLFRSQGKYVVFLDHDDRLLPQAAEIGVSLLEEHPKCTIAVGEHRYIGADGQAIGHSEKRASGRDHYGMLLEHNFIETPCSALIRRSGLVSAGVFDESIQGAEDLELYLRIARQSDFIAHDAAVAEYRLHDSNTSRNAEKMLLVSHRVLEMELPYVEGDAEKLRLQRRGLKFVGRHYGRRLTRELMGNGSLKNPEYRRKLKLLGRHYALGLVAVMVSQLFPAKLLNFLLTWRARRAEQTRHARQTQGRESLSLG